MLEPMEFSVTAPPGWGLSFTMVWIGRASHVAPRSLLDAVIGIGRMVAIEGAMMLEPKDAEPNVLEALKWCLSEGWLRPLASDAYELSGEALKREAALAAVDAVGSC